VCVCTCVCCVCVRARPAELKAEVEKLRAAQASSQGVEPERVRLFQQEIAGLRSKLTQQDREMLEAQRSALTHYSTIQSFTFPAPTHTAEISHLYHKGGFV